MTRKILVLIASVLALGIGAGTAMADDGQARTIGQTASNSDVPGGSGGAAALMPVRR